MAVVTGVKRKTRGATLCVRVVLCVSIAWGPQSNIKSGEWGGGGGGRLLLKDKTDARERK